MAQTLDRRRTFYKSCFLTFACLLVAMLVDIGHALFCLLVLHVAIKVEATQIADLSLSLLA